MSLFIACARRHYEPERKTFVENMALAQMTRFESLNKKKCDTSKLFMEALLVKNDMWQYVNGTYVKLEIMPNNAASEQAARIWKQNDAKARSDILSISSTELKQVKGCVTSREVWLRLKNTY